MPLSWPAKDPNEVLDFDLDWSERLGSDTISASVWLLSGSGTVVMDSNTHTSTATKLWLSGGTVGETNVLTNRVTTAAGRVMDQSVKLKIKEK